MPDTIVQILVPADVTATAHGIDAGSAIVAALPTDGTLPDRTLVYYESNRYGAVDLMRFADRAYQAFSRLSVSYPTVACAAVPTADFKVVAHFDPSAGRIDVLDPEALDAWAPGLTSQDFMTSSIRHQLIRDGFPSHVTPSSLARFAATHPTHPAVIRSLRSRSTDPASR